MVTTRAAYNDGVGQHQIMRCPDCKYDLAGLPISDGFVRCPECGGQFNLQALRNQGGLLQWGGVWCSIGLCLFPGLVSTAISLVPKRFAYGAFDDNPIVPLFIIAVFVAAPILGSVRLIVRTRIVGYGSKYVVA